MNLDRLQADERIVAVVLFGSTARLDADEHSDRDIVVLCRHSDIGELQKTRRNIVVPAIGTREGVCCYRVSDFESMAKKGSLFLWHLKLQGKIVFSRDDVYQRILDSLAPYNNYEEDLRCYAELFADVADSLDRRGGLSEFDLSVLFTIVRNTCILLCYHRGRPKFSRSNPYLTARGLFADSFPLDDWVYPELCSWKLWYERGVKPRREVRDESHFRVLLKEVRKLLEFSAEQCVWKNC